MAWFNCITAFRNLPDTTASDANGGVSLFLVPSNVALKLTNARTAAIARIAPVLHVRSLTLALGIQKHEQKTKMHHHHRPARIGKNDSC